MIEKITNQNQIARNKLAEKINELVDAVNVLQAQVAILQEHAHPTATTEPADPYAEQRKEMNKRNK
jgi:FtsZ-binding cell division protein ZapB